MKHQDELYSEFWAAISPWTLHFRDPMYERLYIHRRLNSPVHLRYIKLSFFFLIFIIGWACYEIFAAPQDMYKPESLVPVSVILALLTAAMMSEFVIVHRFPVMRGVLLLIMCYVYAFYRSYTVFSSAPALLHM
ncbi:MAG: hypothetical protein P4M11_02335 [Candidatus Pacebacteria bacterium]|nr:hypothetical protein [Candidatus Paceibacterota bacterium]